METSSQIKHERDVESDARMEEESGHSETESEESNSSSSDYDISPERVRKYVIVCSAMVCRWKFGCFAVVCSHRAD